MRVKQGKIATVEVFNRYLGWKGRKKTIHGQLQHNIRKVNFKMICLKSFKTAFLRQINEGVRIASCQADICMNSKAEFHQPSIVKVSTGLRNHKEEQTDQPASQGGGRGVRGGRGGRGCGRDRGRGSAGGW